VKRSSALCTRRHLAFWLHATVAQGRSQSAHDQSSDFAMERESRGVQSTADLEQLLARPPRAPSLRLRRHWFVFTDADPFCGIDLDHCRAVKGTIGLEALDMIRRFASYTELSPSGTGAHILIKGKLYGPGNRTRNIEIYDSGRYFTVTGKHLSGTPFAIHNRQEALEALERELFSSEVSFPNEALVNARIMSDEELIERAKSARNGDRFRRLWAGDASDYGDDHSRADLALCRMLAFWCGPDGERVDRLFRRSGLMRTKWDRRTGDTAYGILTVKRAITRS
jgi:putative DNA primase/helicase